MATAVLQEKTGFQLHQASIQSYDNELHDENQDVSWYDKLDLLIRDPTIALVRSMYVAPALASAWSVEGTDDAPDGATDLIREELLPLKIHLTRRAMLDCLDYGWSPYEKIFQIRKDNFTGIKKLKHLLQRLTTILVKRRTGEFIGLFQDFEDIDVDEQILQVEKSLLFNFDVTGTNWYGSSTTKNAEACYDQYKAVNTRADSFDNKVAGAHWLIKYPPGVTPIEGEGNVDNFTVATRIRAQLQANSTIIVPQIVRKEVAAFNKNLSEDDAWVIELITADGTAGAGFTDRLVYCDKLKVRAFGFPERSILEGQFGTKAEAAEHADFAITNVELRHAELLLTINWHLVNHLLRINYGEGFDNTVMLVANPLQDMKRKFLKVLYEKIISDPSLLYDESSHYDMEAIREALEIPQIELQEDERLPVLLVEKQKEGLESQEGEGSEGDNTFPNDEEGGDDGDDEENDNDED